MTQASDSTGKSDSTGNQARRGGAATGALLAGAVSLLALPSAVLAFSTRFEPVTAAAPDPLGQARNQAQLASAIPVRSLVKGHPFRFTPAGTPTRPDRSVTVAVRVDPQIAREITVRASRVRIAQTAGATALQLSPTAFNLGVSRGYQSFAQNLVPAPTVEIRKIEMPDLSKFPAGAGARPGTSRFSPRIALEEKPALGRAPRTFSGEGEDRVDVGGSLRLTQNLDVTAGVRYSAQDRDRLHPLTDGKQDSQAVYVGTQFRF